MKIPDTLIIQGHTYEVEKRKMDDMCGQTIHSDLKITIDNTRPQSIQEETLIHEALHALRAQLGQEKSDTAEEERTIQPLALGIYQVLKDNKFLK